MSKKYVQKKINCNKNQEKIITNKKMKRNLHKNKQKKWNEKQPWGEGGQ